MSGAETAGLVGAPAGARAAWVAAVADLRDRHGLQARALAALSDQAAREGRVPRPYSKSSWQRVLSGESLPPEWAWVLVCEWKGEDPQESLPLLRAAQEPAGARPAQGSGSPASPRVPADAEQAGGGFGGPPVGGTAGDGRRVGLAALMGAAGLLAGVALVLMLAVALVVGWLLVSPGPEGPAEVAGSVAVTGSVEMVPGRPPETGQAPPATVDSGAAAQLSVGSAPDGEVSCRGEQCRGLDVGEAGCRDDAVTLAEGPVVGASPVSVRFSPACGAVWVNASGVAAGTTVALTDVTSGTAMRAVSRDEEWTRTRMLPDEDGHRFRACVEAPGAAPACLPVIPR